jgi:hypothetical protein
MPFLEAEGLESTHIYRPSKKARTFFAVMSYFGFVMGVWLISRCVPDRLANGTEALEPICA